MGESIRLALSTANVVRTIAHLVAAIILTWWLVMTYRWIARRSAILGHFFAAGVMIRAVGGVALFLISFFGWPFFRSLQLGGGFWTLALDSRTYYDISVNSALHGLSSISDTFPSPLYMRTLAVWMWIFGLSPASALLLNVAAYAASVALIVTTAGIHRHSGLRDVGGPIVTVAAFTFSPALLVFSTQPLKDPLCLLLLIAAMCGARMLWTAPAGTKSRGGHSAIGTALLTVGVYGLAGIRPYVCVFVIAAVIMAAVYKIIRDGSAGRRFRDALQHVALVALLWMVFVVGAGPYAPPYVSTIASIFGTPSKPVAVIDSARAGFAASGGATSIAGPRETADESTLFFVSSHRRLGRLMLGLAVFFVPISALAKASIITFSGGQGLLVITDLDTIAIDVTVALIFGLVLRSAKRHRLSCATIFALALGLLLTAAMAYVVTNYGTLFRLRLMGVAPFWMLPVMLPLRRDDDSAGLRVG